MVGTTMNDSVKCRTKNFSRKGFGDMSESCDSTHGYAGSPTSILLSSGTTENSLRQFLGFVRCVSVGTVAIMFLRVSKSATSAANCKGMLSNLFAM